MIVDRVGLSLIAVTFGCGGGDERPDAQIDAVGVDARGQCNGLVNPAEPVQSFLVADIRPSGTGGTILDGIYHRVSHTIFTGVGGATGPFGEPVAETHAFYGVTVLVSSASSLGITNLTLECGLNGAQISCARTCPDD